MNKWEAIESGSQKSKEGKKKGFKNVKKKTKLEKVEKWKMKIYEMRNNNWDVDDDIDFAKK